MLRSERYALRSVGVSAPVTDEVDDSVPARFRARDDGIAREKTWWVGALLVVSDGAWYRAWRVSGLSLGVFGGGAIVLLFGAENAAK